MIIAFCHFWPACNFRLILAEVEGRGVPSHFQHLEDENAFLKGAKESLIRDAAVSLLALSCKIHRDVLALLCPVCL
ncbi:hypothetical protein FIBSPDRAFT_785333 [Athelia psychrophila]|uniref:Uncharacterized protein n=1 Tax=Athelia psychrophila TaxID=1759441 RepID=A0A166MIC9_9AGAM|nr:hypothetical protein FIBSPDRAFT_785333 [Fibularhizoctonia sp. CBS 109695]